MSDSTNQDNGHRDPKAALHDLTEQDQPVLYQIMQEILAEGDGPGEGAFSDMFRSGTEGGRFSSHWSHSSGLVTEQSEEKDETKNEEDEPQS